MKRKRTYPKSANKVDFKPNTTIYEKTVDFEGKPFKIKMDVSPRKPSEPTIEMKERR